MSTQGKHHDLPPQTETTVDEVGTRYDGKWILMRVTERDGYAVPTKGIVLAIGNKRGDIDEQTLACVLEGKAKKSGEEFYVFRAFPRVESMSELRYGLPPDVLKVLKGNE